RRSSGTDATCSRCLIMAVKHHVSAEELVPRGWRSGPAKPTANGLRLSAPRRSRPTTRPPLGDDEETPAGWQPRDETLVEEYLAGPAVARLAYAVSLALG